MEPARDMEGLDSEEGDTAMHAESTQSNRELRGNTQKAKKMNKIQTKLRAGGGTEWVCTSVPG